MDILKEKGLLLRGEFLTVYAYFRTDTLSLTFGDWQILRVSCSASGKKYKG